MYVVTSSAWILPVLLSATTDHFAIIGWRALPYNMSCPIELASFTGFRSFFAHSVAAMPIGMFLVALPPKAPPRRRQMI